MSRIFNILITHRGNSYPALLTIAGEAQENASVRVITGEEKIEIVVGNGSLTFSTAEVVKQLLKAMKSSDPEQVMHITRNISLQLLNT
jgi:hypothetical protein